MEDIRREEVVKAVADFKKMAALADGLEDVGDGDGALAIRVALYDKIMGLADRIEFRYGGEEGMARMAAEGMTKEAVNWGGLWKGLQGAGRNLMNVFRGRNLGQGANAVLDAARAGGHIPGVKPGIGQRVLNRMTAPGKTQLLEKVGGSAPVRDAFGNTVTEAIPDAYRATKLGRGVAIGGTAALGAAGAASLINRGQRPEQIPGGQQMPSDTMPNTNYPGAPPPGVGGMGGPGMGGGMGAPGGGMGGPGGGMGGMEAQQIQQIGGALQGLAGRVEQIDARVRTLEGGGRPV